MDAENIGKQFPSLPRHSWRSDWPYIVTLIDGTRLPAYPAVGKIDENNNFCVGEICNDMMWYVSDRLVEHVLITELQNGRIIYTQHVAAFNPLQPSQLQS